MTFLCTYGYTKGILIGGCLEIFLRIQKALKLEWEHELVLLRNEK